jgi:uncharacterized protein (DUF1015 family)
MAQIIPFRGVRYNPDRIADPSAVVTAPYDRIDAEQQQAYYARSPYNIVRIIKGRPQAGDNGQNVYTRAADTLAAWRRDQIVVRDETPSLYAYHQTYRFAGQELVRKGVIALGKLEPERVHAHERTLRGPKEDRLRLMRATQANFGHIFMLYSDPSRTVNQALGPALGERRPTVEATDDFGNTHRVWQITDSRAIRAVQDALADKDLYIADGHHRYETAVTFMRECQEKGWRSAAPESFDVRMMALFNIDLPGMTIRPIHRLLHGLRGYDAEAFLRQAAEAFEVERFDTAVAWQDAVRAGRDRHTFGCYTSGIYATLGLRDEALMDRLISTDRSADWKRLDVSILHTAILEKLLGIDAAALEEERNVTYTVNPEDGIARVDAGEEQAFLLLNATSPEEVRRVADHGEKMPQKSTDFYPKLLTGLVFSVMEIDR